MTDHPTTSGHDPAAEGWKKIAEDGFAACIGGLWRRDAEDGAHMGLVTDARHLNRDGRVHGGVLLTLADHAMGTALHDDGQDHKQATIQLDLQFVDSPGPGTFLDACAHVSRRGRSVAFVRVEISVEGRLVATANGIWRVFAPR